MSTKKFELPWWYRQVPRDFMSSPDVQLMTAEECGSYFFLLQWAWLGGQDCTLPNDPARLARLARVEKVSDLVLRQFKDDKDGRLYNQRLSHEWKEALKRSKDAKNAISARWGKENGSNTPVSRPKNGGITTNTNTNTQTHTKKKQVTSQAQVVASTASDEASNSASRETRTPSESAARVAEKLAAILGRENLKPTTVKAWAELAERILANHSEQDVLAVMQWALVDSENMFWRGRVYSMKHFANFFKTIHQQYGIKDAGTRKAADPLAARAASLNTGHDFSAMAKGDL